MELATRALGSLGLKRVLFCLSINCHRLPSERRADKRGAAVVVSYHKYQLQLTTIVGGSVGTVALQRRGIITMQTGMGRCRGINCGKQTLVVILAILL